MPTKQKIAEKIPSTEDVIKGMLTENTGMHFLDSGGVYGRHWQHNQKRDFDAEPACHVDYSEDGMTISYNLYHFLVNHLEYDRDCDYWMKAFTKFAEDPKYKNTGWDDIIEDWIKERRFEYLGGYNTYNHDNLLDQDIAYYHFANSKHEYIFLQVHGGCDIRGGYTEPKIFRMDDESSFYLDMGDCYATCSKCGASWSSDDCGYHWDISFGGIPPVDPNQLEFKDMPKREPIERKFDDIKVTDDGAYCPICEGKIEFGVTDWMR